MSDRGRDDAQSGGGEEVEMLDSRVYRFRQHRILSENGQSHENKHVLFIKKRTCQLVWLGWRDR